MTTGHRGPGIATRQGPPVPGHQPVSAKACCPTTSTLTPCPPSHSRPRAKAWSCYSQCWGDPEALGVLPRGLSHIGPGVRAPCPAPSVGHAQVSCPVSPVRGSEVTAREPGLQASSRAGGLWEQPPGPAHPHLSHSGPGPSPRAGVRCPPHPRPRLCRAQGRPHHHHRVVGWSLHHPDPSRSRPKSEIAPRSSIDHMASFVTCVSCPAVTCATSSECRALEPRWHHGPFCVCRSGLPREGWEAGAGWRHQRHTALS